MTIHGRIAHIIICLMIATAVLYNYTLAALIAAFLLGYDLRDWLSAYWGDSYE